MPAPAACPASAATIPRSCRSCPRAATPPRRTSPGTTSRCRAGEGTFFEIAGCYDRYHCPLSRTIFLGRPTQAFLDAEAATLEGMEAGLAAARPGNACEDIANAFFGVLAGHGIVKDNRTGYSIGLSYPPDWGERTMSLRPGDRTELRPGMTFHFMTGLWLETMGLEITESILITDTGVECLANVPRQAPGDRLTLPPVARHRPPSTSRAPGVQHGFLRLPYSRDDSAWGSVMIPIAVVRGGTGPTALLTGGNHGDEYEGPLALFDLARTLDPATVSRHRHHRPGAQPPRLPRRHPHLARSTAATSTAASPARPTAPSPRRSPTT